MGIVKWLLSLLETGPTPEKPADATGAGVPAFAVIDVETTGLSPRQDRILELAIVRTDANGVVVDEWVSRFDPEGPVGATHIHGIRASDVAGAPLFRDLAPTIAAALGGVTIVAHNAKFDTAFLHEEFQAAGWAVPRLSTFCTMDGSHHYLPDLQRRRLADCCWGAGVELVDAHSALGDARATAALLRSYLTADRRRPHPTLAALPRTPHWPSAPSRAAVPRRRTAGARTSAPVRITPKRPEQQPLVQQLTNVGLLELIDEGAPVGTIAYLELLLDCLTDGDLSASETSALDELTRTFGLSAADVASAHTAFLQALAHRALDDGRVSQSERQQLLALAALLSVPTASVKTLIDRADAARIARLSAGLGPLPRIWAHGAPLHVGDRVAFTGCDERQREKLERHAEQLGVRVLGNVSRLTAVLVADGSFSGGKHERALEHGTRIVHPDTFEILLEHLQPARSSAEPERRSTPAAPRSRPSEVIVAVPSPARSTASPSEIRSWALANGHEVGVRGRLPKDVIAAFEAARSRA
ncbi:exonuclease domain-containing protein [Rathayibacter festucae]|uniref:exonuclease domain-containing protein n=1 Tax=Rathayibacter festucae TaxID=110937 RepID=UPI002A69EE4D|nr:histone-like nucleoid-structuring protein Lsr2 [Rathayibacter festucae]MDY0914736.1 histone-like nucleoid-structuring protein Lsr2 [Rathayibacter festucae]